MDIMINLTKHIQDTLATQSDKPRNYIGASSIGNPCLRAIWYGLRMPETKVVEPQQKMTFEIGKRLEALILYLLTDAGFRIGNFISYECKDYPLFSGTPDCVVLGFKGEIYQSPFLIEIKTAKNDSFRVFQKKGLRLSWAEYYDQVQSYMGMSGITRTVVIALNKDTSEFHEEWVEFNPIWYASLVEKARVVGEAIEPPARISDRPTWFKCKMCFYNKECHGQ